MCLTCSRSKRSGWRNPLRYSHAILVTIFCAFSLPARGQALVHSSVDHDWTIHYRMQRYGLVQVTILASPPSPSWTHTTIWLGSRHFSVNHTIWPVAGVISISIISFGWLFYFGLGSIFKPDKKPPPPKPSPPP